MRRRNVAGGGDDESRSSSSSRPRVTLETFDLFPKVEKEERVQTSTGAGVSVVSFIIIALLVLSEGKTWLWPVTREHVTVDSAIEGRVRINFDISLHALRCDDVNLDAMDVAGEQQNGVDHDFTKTKLSSAGKPVGQPSVAALPSRVPGAAMPSPDAPPLPPDYCGGCYGARGEGVCCNTCDDVRLAYSERGWDPSAVMRDAEQCIREGRTAPEAMGGDRSRRAAGAAEGCRLSGFLLVNKVAGNFHIAMGETHQRGAGHIHQFNPMAIADYNVSHTINALSFGAPYTGALNPLDASTHTPKEGAAVYMYYLKVIPTTVRVGSSSPLHTYQYSVSSQMRPAVVNGQRQNVLPGLFFVYELAPYLVTVDTTRGSFLAFLTGLCAILGGVVTLARLTDTILHGAGVLLRAGGVDTAAAAAAVSAATTAAGSAALNAVVASASKVIQKSPMATLSSPALALHSDSLRSAHETTPKAMASAATEEKSA